MDENHSMKKSILFLSLALTVLIFVSCGKKQVCECVYKDNGKETYRDSSTINEGSEEKNKEACDQGDATTTNTVNGNTTTSTIDCEIKD